MRRTVQDLATALVSSTTVVPEQGLQDLKPANILAGGVGLEPYPPLCSERRLHFL